MLLDSVAFDYRRSCESNHALCWLDRPDRWEDFFFGCPRTAEMFLRRRATWFDKRLAVPKCREDSKASELVYDKRFCGLFHLRRFRLSLTSLRTHHTRFRLRRLSRFCWRQM